MSVEILFLLDCICKQFQVLKTTAPSKSKSGGDDEWNNNFDEDKPKKSAAASFGG